MIMQDEKTVYDIMNKNWKSTCKILLGEEIGELSDFKEWLLEYTQVPRFEKSTFSGKDVSLTMKDYGDSARFASFDEVDFNKRFEPLSINEIKDIDSILEAVQERMYYTGNAILGHSNYVALSSNVIDSNFVYCSNAISDSKYMAYCREVRFAESCFGFYSGATSKFTMKVTDVGRLNRCFECHTCELNSDLYYCITAENSKECMFSFGLIGETYRIGNLKLPKEKYHQLKKKIISEIALKLKKEKRAISLFEIIERAAKERGSTAKITPTPETPFDKKPVEEAFSRTSSLIFKKPLDGIDNYAKFLEKHVPSNVVLTSQLTGNKVVQAGNFRPFFDKYGIASRMLDVPEIRQISK
ncbi:MAG: hypothetical protein ABIG39_00730, partial [Candidatus Micrarchaeota archaeon]